MDVRRISTIPERIEMVQCRFGQGMSRRAVAAHCGYSRSWVRTWSRRYRAGGEAALVSVAPPPPGPLAHFPTAVRAAVLAFRRQHPSLGARWAVVALAKDESLRGQPVPSVRTIERAWKQEGLLVRRVPASRAPSTPPLPVPAPHAVWQLDHQDHLQAPQIPEPLVMQSVRDPQTGLAIGADVFAGPHGAHAVPEDTLFDAVRRRLEQWGKPASFAVDRGVRFLGQPQRTFPSRFELLCAGWGIPLHQTRPGHPTDNGAVERQHLTIDAFFAGATATDLPALQAFLDAHLTDLNERFPSRAKGCGGRPPLVAHPTARHSGRPFVPDQEWATFDMAAVHQRLAAWRWHRRADKHGAQISFGHRNYSLGAAHRGEVVALRFDPAAAEVVVSALGTTPETLGPEIKRFHCPFFDKDHILGSSQVAWRPPAAGAEPADASAVIPEGPSL